MFVFPDTEDPKVSKLPDVKLNVGSTETVDLSDKVSDSDNMDAAIVKTVNSVKDNDVVSASMQNGKLMLIGLKPGSTSIKLDFNSNGIVVSKDLAVTIDNTTGITSVTNDNQNANDLYNLSGQRVNTSYKGVVIRNGKKVLVTK